MNKPIHYLKFVLAGKDSSYIWLNIKSNQKISFENRPQTGITELGQCVLHILTTRWLFLHSVYKITRFACSHKNVWQPNHCSVPGRPRRQFSISIRVVLRKLVEFCNVNVPSSPPTAASRLHPLIFFTGRDRRTTAPNGSVSRAQDSISSDYRGEQK